MTNPIDFQHLGIAEAIKRNQLAVPSHQREYSWTDREVTQLFDDLARSIAEGDDVYFLGTIVLTSSEDGTLQVVDGQQRLATVSILLGAIRDYLFELNDELLVRSLDDFLFSIDRENREIVPRLSLNVDDNEFFRSRILERANKKERKSAKPTCGSHELIEQAAILAKDRVSAIVAQYSKDDRIVALNNWVKFLERSVQVILAIATNDANAFVMFETLNDRGLRTSQADLVKNYLFSQAGKRIKEAQNRWSRMRGTIEAIDDDLTMTYLRHVTISRYGHTREREVFERIRSKVRRPVDAIRFLEILSDSANDYVALLTSEHPIWNKYSASTRERVRTLCRTLKVTALRPVMLSVLQKFSKSRVEKSFHMFLNWSMRILIVGGLRSGRVEEACAIAAHGIATGNIKTPDELKSAMLKVIPDDSAFRETFATKRVSQAAFARYFLRALELKRKSDPEPEWIPNDDMVINLEHVLPGSSDELWDNFDPELAAAYHKRIGNLALLQASKNSDIGNTDFISKKRVYEGSTFLLTKEIADKNTWGPVEIDERQNKLAELAVKTWPL